MAPLKKSVLCVIGTRPEAIKMAPVIMALRNEDWAEVCVIATAQHRQMLDQGLHIFGIEPDLDLNIMQPTQALGDLTARLLKALDDVFSEKRPDVVLAQGDTTTVLAAALASFYHHVPFGHVEAGLRTGDLTRPFPEEMNRVISGRLSHWHFAPTELSRQNLLNEGISDTQIHVTGNTVIDALHCVDNMQNLQSELPAGIDATKRLILVTSHRRESFGEPIQEICRALRALAIHNAGVQFVYPVHPNPNVRGVVYQMLSDLSNMYLCEPLNYTKFIAVMKHAYFIITDSGGVQEEAPALRKPVLLVRDDTERPEAVEQGVARLIGTDYENIVQEVQHLLDDELAYSSMAKGISPFGDGHASERIVKILREYFY